MRSRRLGVEALFFLEHIVVPLEEQNSGAIGGELRSLRSHVLRALEALQCVFFDGPMVFVFNGLAPVVTPFAADLDVRGDKMKSMWATVSEQGNGREEVTAKFVGVSCQVTERDLWLVLRDLGEECVVAPHRAWAQLAYLARDDYIDFVLGSAANLMFGDGSVRLVTNVNLPRSDFCFVDGSSIYAKLGVSPLQLLDAIVRKQKLELRLQKSVKAKFLKRVEIAKRSEHVTSSAVLAMHHMGALNADCQMELYDTCAENAPSSAVLTELFGRRLSNFVYFALCEGCIQPRLLDVMVTGKLVEREPALDSFAYRLLLYQLIPLNCLTLGLLAEGLHPSFCSASFLSIRYYEPGKTYPIKLHLGERLLNFRVAPDEVKREWRSFWFSVCCSGLKCLFFVKALRTMSRVDLSSVARVLLETKIGLGSFLSCLHGNRVCETEEELLFQVLVEGLRLMGRLNESFPEKDVEACLVVFELMKLRLLNGDSLQLGGGLQAAALGSTNQVLLLSRLFALLEAEDLDENPWSGPVDVDLAAFSCISAAMWESMRSLFEVVALRMWTDGLSG